MAKKSALSLALAKLNQQIEILTACRDLLEAAASESGVPTRGKRRLRQPSKSVREAESVVPN